MMHTLEWSRAYTGRLQRDAAAVFAARAPELSRRLETECAQGSLPFLTMPYRERLERELPPHLGDHLLGFHVLLERRYVDGDTTVGLPGHHHA